MSRADFLRHHQTPDVTPRVRPEAIALREAILACRSGGTMVTHLMSLDDATGGYAMFKCGRNLAYETWRRRLHYENPRRDDAKSPYSVAG